MAARSNQSAAQASEAAAASPDSQRQRTTSNRKWLRTAPSPSRSISSKVSATLSG